MVDFFFFISKNRLCVRNRELQAPSPGILPFFFFFPLQKNPTCSFCLCSLSVLIYVFYFPYIIIFQVSSSRLFSRHPSLNNSYLLLDPVSLSLLIPTKYMAKEYSRTSLIYFLCSLSIFFLSNDSILSAFSTLKFLCPFCKKNYLFLLVLTLTWDDNNKHEKNLFTPLTGNTVGNKSKNASICSRTVCQSKCSTGLV